MPSRLDTETRDAIAAAIRADGKRNEIARDFKVSPGSVSNIANEYGLTSAFDRTATARASAAKRVDNAAVRAKVSALLLNDALRLRDRMWEPADQVVPSGQIVTLDLPSARDVRDFASAIASNMRTHLEQDRHDSDADTEGAKSVLIGMLDGLRELQRHRDQPPAGE